MIGVANQKNAGPKVTLEAVLRFNGGELIARGNDTTIKDNQVILAWR